MLDLLEKLSKSLDNAYNQTTVVSTIRDFFIRFFNITKLDIYIFDERFNIVRDFSQEWFNPDAKTDENKKQAEIYSRLNKEIKFIEEKTLYYILPKHSNPVGFLRVEAPQFADIEKFLKIASYIISLKIQNVVLADNMQKNIDFHELMRNIAKIIETQYELSYIIPLIGEMIDKFMSNLLTYIFVKENGEFKLLWPTNCIDSNILGALKLLDETSKQSIIENGRIGIFPLITENHLLGCIAVKTMNTPLNEYDIDYLEQLAKQSATTINRANVYSEILRHATLDALTGFYNRRQLEERIKQEAAKAKRQKTPLCAIMTDIDFFKKVNDVYGHAVGDLVLKTVSKTIRTQLREYDIAGRYGGEEFAILLPFTRTEEAIMVAERLRNAVEKTTINLAKVNPDAPQKTINVTISVGIYEFKSSDDAEDLLKKADKALYEAKDTGRNRVIINKDEK